MRREESALECLDRPVPPADLAASLDDIERLDAWFRGYALTLDEIARATARAPRERPFVVVDVGGGRGDLAVRVARWARRAGRCVRILVIDQNGESLRLGARVSAEFPADVVTCALLLHHLGPDAVVASLAEMAAASRDAVVVNDLLRSWRSWGLVWLATRLLARHRFSRHDGPLSVRRAYAPEELRALAEKAGLRRARIVPRRLWARVLVLDP
jgi:2-polyprenyl-3-methyl-5-hydroxy-6-metoxy-1,4-benzoquinol methylase